MSIAATAMLIGVAGCSQSEEKSLESVREQVAGKQVVAVGDGSKLVLPEVKAQAEKKPDDFQAQLDLAKVAAEARDWDVAVQAAERATRLDPSSIAAKEVYAQCLQQQGRMDEATAQWEAIVASGQPHSPLIDTNLGNSYKMQGRLQDAERMYLKALEDKDGTHGLVFLNLADLQIKLGKYDEATQTILAGLAEDPKQRYAHGLLGRIAFLKGDYESAVGELGIELGIRPTAWEAYFLLALAQGRRQPPQMEKAEECFSQLAQLRPSDTGYHKALLADLYLDIGQLEKGKALALEALSEVPAFRQDQRSAVYHALSKAHLKLGDRTQAAEFHTKFRQSLGQTDSNDPEQRRRIREMDSLFGGG
jgi:tetratricopeptide (TPR) repeat protein